jgi:hypothetical protein
MTNHVNPTWRCVQCEVIEVQTENEATQHTVETSHSIQKLIFSNGHTHTDIRWIPNNDNNNEG